MIFYHIISWKHDSPLNNDIKRQSTLAYSDGTWQMTKCLLTLVIEKKGSLKIYILGIDDTKETNTLAYSLKRSFLMCVAEIV